MAGTPLGEFLRARRAAVTPEQLSLPSSGPRRVPGLRREEVALLAGVSADYYVRLEQGRERNPSPQVLESVAAVLQLSDDARLHLYRLAGLAPTPSRSAPEVDPHLRRLMEAWPDNPALVINEAVDVLAGNALAYQLFPGIDRYGNLVRHMFLDPDAPAFYGHWEDAAAYAVANLRYVHGAHPDDQRIRAVVAELTTNAPEFRRLWERNDPRLDRLRVKSFRHPEVGPLTLRMETFDVRSAPGQELLVYHAEAGTADAAALAELGRLATAAPTAP
jgi:transcriptional regulator with XRE-family HTH domain